MSRLSRQWGILNISQPYRPPWSVIEIALPFYFYLRVVFNPVVDHHVRLKTSYARFANYEMLLSICYYSLETPNSFSHSHDAVENRLESPIHGSCSAHNATRVILNKIRMLKSGKKKAKCYHVHGPPLWSSGQSSWLQIRRPGFDSRHYKKKSSGSGTGSTQSHGYNWGATW
jgi:hypothetical protein